MATLAGAPPLADERDVELRGGESAALLVGRRAAMPSLQDWRCRVGGALGAVLLASLLLALLTLSRSSNVGPASAAAASTKGFTSLDSDATVPVAALELPVILRDFDGNVPSKSINIFGNVCDESPYIVQDTLPGGGKPLWRGPGQVGDSPDEGSSADALINSQEELDALWTTVDGVNVEYPSFLSLAQLEEGHYKVELPEFFPLDSVKPPFQPDAKNSDHNYFFSLELHANFTYRGGESFYFRGDDDAFLYINNKLVLNLGGCHPPALGSVDMTGLGLQPGRDYPFDFFFATRECCGSSIRIDTDLQFVPPVAATTIKSTSDYSCCFFGFMRLPWICYDHKKFPWCGSDSAN